jgi:ABC-type multidrug transport system fused ATPase/permease subunit
VEQPTTIPLSLASLHLITQTTNTFTYTAFSLYDETGAIAEKLSAVRLLYEIVKIPNRVKVEIQEKTNLDVDYDDPLLGTPFPEDQQSLNFGVSIEFIHVSFKYPGTDTYALRDVSFKIEKGQLCVRSWLYVSVDVVWLILFSDR